MVFSRKNSHTGEGMGGVCPLGNFSHIIPFFLKTFLMCYLHLCCLSKFYIISCGCPLGKLGILEPLQHDLRERGEKDLFLFPQSLLDPPANGNLINCSFEIRRRGDIEDATWPRMEGANQPAPKERGKSKVILFGTPSKSVIK